MTCFLFSRTSNLYEVSFESCRWPVVYASVYNISFLGVEKLHPFDSGKWGRVYQYLVGNVCVLHVLGLLFLLHGNIFCDASLFQMPSYFVPMRLYLHVNQLMKTCCWFILKITLTD